MLLLCQGGTRFQGVEDDACELAFEAADRFAAALAFGLFTLEVGARFPDRLDQSYARSGVADSEVAACLGERAVTRHQRSRSALLS